jgi:hypothetical protein
MATRKKATKSKTQSKAKSKRTKAKDIHLPDGYKVIGRAPNWDVDKYPIIAGERSETREVTLNAGDKKKERTLRTCVVTDEQHGPQTVWESGMLKDFFDSTEEGDNVRIEFVGYGQAKKGQNAPKLFSCAVKE